MLRGLVTFIVIKRRLSLTYLRVVQLVAVVGSEHINS
jgi:hypothetical protein